MKVRSFNVNVSATKGYSPTPEGELLGILAIYTCFAGYKGVFDVQEATSYAPA